MDFALLGLRFDKTQTLRKGAGEAPKIIRAVFPKLENYIFGVDLSESFIEDMGDIGGKDIEELTAMARAKLGSTKRFPILIGGEHTVTLAGVRAVKPDFVVVMDAHADCEKSDGHDGIVRKLVEELGPDNVVLYGVRVASFKESEYIKSRGIRIIHNPAELKKLRGRVYLSIDYDVLDPSVILTVGNPEPMGLQYQEVSEAVKAIADRLVAVDFVEFTPMKSDVTGIYALVAGKLIYSTMASVVKAKK
ncbi:MAG: arginase family protein [Candidatus Aenigmatarchaeota archaeon]